jgi:type 1 glutamine amidotransferase/nicotinamidase-related amidase
MTSCLLRHRSSVRRSRIGKMALNRRSACRLLAAASMFASLPLMAGTATDTAVTVCKRVRVERDGRWQEQITVEKWQPRETAVIVCDVWDAHHCLNAVRRIEEMAPRMNELLEAARARGALVVHAPSGCMARYEKHPARLRAMQAPAAPNLPAGIGEWCYRIPAEEKGRYPLDQEDGGEDDNPVEHRQWHERLAGMNRDPKAPWKAQIDVLRIDERDAISDSGVEIWNLLEERRIRNVVLLGVHANMCVLGRPFGLRQMARNGKNVVLVRDLTDTMYNPQRWPFVTHFVGTDRIVEHIEKFVCPTITSVDFLGGQPFRFRADRRSILIAIGESEYSTNETLPEFARKELERSGFRVTIVQADEKHPNDFPGLAEAAKAADLMLISVRRRTPTRAQLDTVQAHLAAGKPLVGIRTASHAFALANNETPEAGRATWPDFDPAVLGGRYAGHWGEGPKVSLTLAPGANDHPLLVGIDPLRMEGNGSLYRVTPLEASTTPLIIGAVPGHPPEPVAWTNIPRAGKSRIFYTSLGHPDDFKNAMFRKLLLNGLCWALDIAPPGMPE